MMTKIKLSIHMMIHMMFKMTNRDFSGEFFCWYSGLVEAELPQVPPPIEACKEVPLCDSYSYASRESHVNIIAKPIFIYFEI